VNKDSDGIEVVAESDIECLACGHDSMYHDVMMDGSWKCLLCTCHVYEFVRKEKVAN
jgi:hypothetical protein